MSSTPTAQDPLAELRDIHLPEQDISSLPTAPGWWILITIIITSLVVGVFLWRKHQHNNRYRHQALAALSVININNPNSQIFTQQLNTLLKQTAKAAYPSHTCLSLHGQQWLDFLKLSAPNITMSDELSAFLLNSSYQPISNPDMHKTAHDYVADWLKKHIKSGKIAS
jgi:hypothetical protein